MIWTWERRIARAGELSSHFPESSNLLTFYQHVARFQKSIADKLSVDAQTDPCVLVPYYPDLFKLVSLHGPPELAGYGRERLSTAAAQEDVLIDIWGGNPPEAEPAKFFARALLQPFAESLAARGHPAAESAVSNCPFCSARPVAGILRGEGEGAKRSLLCSLCATEWQYRRIVCPNCGEENKDHLPVYLADDPGYVRVDACDTCRTYIKSVDLTKNGRAVPVVEELATLTLTLWAEENGYAKLETNLLGM
jgi:FdhE protein